MTSLDTQLDRLLAPDYLDGIHEFSLERVREMRAECQEAETSVSYLRRIVQGRLDIVHAYLDRGEDESITGLDDILEKLPAIISSGPQRPAGYGRLPSRMSPDLEGEYAVEVDKIPGADRMAELDTMSRDELLALAQSLSEVETSSSDKRRALHERIDKLQSEIVSRYKTGEASVEGLLA